MTAPRLRPPAPDANRSLIFGWSPGSSCRGQCECSRLHKVDACMTPQNASRRDNDAVTGVFPAHRRGMANAADTLPSHLAIVTGRRAAGMAPIIARPGIQDPDRRARRIFGVHVHAARCEPT